MSLDELKKLKNKTVGYLLPIVVNKNSKFSDFKDDELFPRCNFINAFRYCEEYPELNKHVFLIYKYSPSPQFQDFIDRFKKYLNYHSIIDNDKYTVIIVFEFPTDSLKTLEHFDNGAYSKYRIEDKKKILNFYSVTVNDKFGPVGVLYKKEWRRLEIEREIDLKLPESAELSSIPNIEQETYYIKYKNTSEPEDIIS
jgi:hypothetical protein